MIIQEIAKYFQNLIQYNMSELKYSVYIAYFR